MVAGRSSPMFFRAIVTIVPSRNTTAEPRIAAASVARCLVVMAGSVRAAMIDRRRLSAVPGPVALVGSGEFVPAMEAVDRELLGSIGRTRPRVAILPTASAPEGEAVFRRWADMGVAHFGAFGAEVEAVLVRDRAGGDDEAASQALGEADLNLSLGRQPGVPRSGPRRLAPRRGAPRRQRRRRH